MTIDIPEDARRRLAEDEVAWLTTVADSGVPAPNPVWFVPDGDELVIFSAPDARKVHNIEQRPRVAVNFNSDAHGVEIVVISGTATTTPDRPPSAQPGYLDKYQDTIIGALGMTVEGYDAVYSTEIRIRPTLVRGMPPA